MADHVTSTAESAGLLPVIVTDAPDVAEWGASRGLPTISDPAGGLDSAGEAGIDWALLANSSWLVVHADLPLLRPADLEEMADVLEAGDDPIAPSSDGGTSAIGGRAPLALAYGPGSFRRHLARLASPRVVVRPGLTLDVDTPGDLQSARRHPAGAWLRGVLD
jgi:2-phospho-L-lactate guanylyltransferase